MAKASKKGPSLQPRELSFEVIGALADKFKVHPLTIERWTESRDVRLTSDLAKKVFAEKNVVWS